MIRGKKKKKDRILKEVGIELGVVKQIQKAGFANKKKQDLPSDLCFNLFRFVSCIAHNNRDYISASIVFLS